MMDRVIRVPYHRNSDHFGRFEHDATGPLIICRDGLEKAYPGDNWGPHSRIEEIELHLSLFPFKGAIRSRIGRMSRALAFFAFGINRYYEERQIDALPVYWAVEVTKEKEGL